MRSYTCYIAAATLGCSGGFSGSTVDSRIRPAGQADWELNNRAMGIATVGDRLVMRLDDRVGDGFAWLKGVEFGEGVIEVEMKGRNIRQRSFVGVAFRAVDTATFDVVYFRPFNFRSPDSAARAHGVQYQSHPHWPWPRTRADWPGAFEQPVIPAPQPDDWFRARIVVRDRRVRVFVNDSPTPVLDVPELTDRVGGGVGLWVGTRSPGEFANLRIRQDLVRSLAEPAAVTAARRMRDAILASDDVVSTVRELTDIGARPPGTANDARARQRIAAALRSAGLDSVWSEPVAVPRWVRGRERAEVIGGSAQTLAVHQLGLSVPTPDSGVVGPIVRFPDAAAVASADPDRLEGKIVFIDHVMPRGRDGSGFAIVGARRGDAVAQAGRAGAVAVIVRAPGTGAHAVPHAVNIGYQPGVRKVPVASLSNLHSDSLAALLARGETPRVKLVLTGRDSAMTTSANVIGEVRGAEFPDEIVLLGAHHDSWDVGTGALDDASGTAIVIEAARRIASMGRPRRTVRFVLFAADELGLRGARAYVIAHSSDRHVLALEPDQGAGRAYRLRTPAGELPPELLDQMEAVLVPMGVQRVTERSFAGPDLIPFRERGVFTLDVAHDMTDFWDYAHSALDVFERIKPDALRATAAAYASVIHLAAYWQAPLASPAGTE